MIDELICLLEFSGRVVQSFKLGLTKCIFLYRCLVDSQIPGSRAHFLPRVQDNKIQLLFDAFKFHDKDNGEVRMSVK